VESGGGKPGYRPRLAYVYKLIAKGTLEEKIQVLQQKKSDLAQSILAEGESQKMALTQEDLQQIFAPLAE